MFKENFPAEEKIKLDLVEATKKLEELKNDIVTEIIVDQDGVATMEFKSGKKLNFSITDEDNSYVALHLE